jgi:hypothetical protein
VIDSICFYKTKFRLVDLTFGQQNANEYKLLVNKADSLYKLKDYTNGAPTYSAAFKTSGWKGYNKDRYRAALLWTKLSFPDGELPSLD